MSMTKIHISLTSAQHEQLTELAKRTETSTAEVIRQLIDNNQKEIKAALNRAAKQKRGIF